MLEPLALPMVMCFGVAQKQKGVADAMIEAENSPLGGAWEIQTTFATG